MIAPTAGRGVEPGAAPDEQGAVQHEAAPAPGRGGGHDEPPGPPPSPRSSPTRSWWWRWGFAVALTVLALSVPVLVVVGARTVLDSSDGRIISTQRDPSAPGWEATVEHTPVQGLALLGPGGELDSVAVLVLSSDARGAVVVAPGATTSGSAGSPTFAEAYAAGGIEGVRVAIEEVIGVGVPAVDRIDAARWSALVAPVAPLRFDNPRSVTAGGVTVDAGAAALSPEQVWPYLSGVEEGETEVERMVRVETFWQAWLASVGEAGDGAAVVPGEVDVGLGRFVRALGGDEVEATLLPAVGDDDGGEIVYVPLADEVEALVTRLVPLPAGPEGARVRVVVLDGTGELDHGTRAAVQLGGAGAQVDAVGNASSFDVAETRLTYRDPSARPEVERLRDALGVGVLVEEPDADPAAAIEVVLGADYLAATEAGGGG